MAITIPILTDFNGRGIDRGIKQFQKLETKGQKAGFLIRKAAIPAALALGAIALAAKAGLDGVMADDEALANLQSTITSTGNAANITSESFFAYANQLQKVTGTGADQITQGAALLATFKNVRNETGKGNQVFNRATKAALDLSKKGFGDLSGSNKMLGKALNDPIRGITALGRAGVTFTDEQKATIKTLQESGRTLDAQKIILKEVEDQVGGTAEAFGATTRGKIERSKRAFEEMQKTLARALLPVLEGAAALFQKLSGFIERNEKIAKILIGVVAGLAAGILILNGVMKIAAATMAIVRVAQVALNLAMTMNPIGLIVVAIGLLVGALILAYNNSETFRNILDKVFDAVKQVVDFLRPIGAAYFDGLKLAFNAIKTVLSGYAAIVTGVFDAFVAVYNFLRPIVAGAFDGIKNAFGKLEGPIGLVKTAFGGLQTLAEGVISVLDKVKTGAFNALATAFRVLTIPVRAFATALQKAKELWDWFTSLGGKNTPTVPIGPTTPGTGLPPGFKVPKSVPRMAEGGIVRSPTLALIGEAGPEAVVPLSGRNAGMGMTINVQAGLVANPDQIGQQIIEAIQRAQRRSGPVFAPA
jgi:hypothetical protein